VNTVGVAVGALVGTPVGDAVGGNVHPPHMPGQNDVTFMLPVPVTTIVPQCDGFSSDVHTGGSGLPAHPKDGADVGSCAVVDVLSSVSSAMGTMIFIIVEGVDRPTCSATVLK
jgi:hypothetical protein